MQKGEDHKKIILQCSLELKNIRPGIPVILALGRLGQEDYKLELYSVPGQPELNNKSLSQINKLFLTFDQGEVCRAVCQTKLSAV